MDLEFRQRFIDRWREYFPGADLPIAFYYTDREGPAEPAPPAQGRQCVICDLAQVGNGRSLRFGVDSVGCTGGKRYLGFTQTLRPNFEYFLSCGIPGELEGERYKKSPGLVREWIKKAPVFKAPARYAVFKRWDKLEENDSPEV